MLKEKFKLLESKLRIWNHEVFGKVDLGMKEAVLELNGLDQIKANDNGRVFNETVARRVSVSSKV